VRDLSEIKQMKEIVPGVLHHHERVDGRVIRTVERRYDTADGKIVGWLTV